MTATRKDLMTPRKQRDGKTHWHKVGAAFPSKNGGDGWTLVFDSLPLPDETGSVRVLMMEPRQPGQGNGNRSSAGTNPRPTPSPGLTLGEELDDDIPF